MCSSDLDTFDETGKSLRPLATPIQVLLRGRGEEAKHSGCIRTILLNQVLRVHHILFGFGHFLKPSDRDLAAALPATNSLLPFLYLIGEEIAVFWAFVYLFANHSLSEKVCERLIHI